MAIDFDSLTPRRAAFIKPMECLPVSKLPEGDGWVYEVKLDGYRAVAVKADLDLTLYSRHQKVLNRQFPYIAAALRELPPGTVVDGEIVALDEAGRPSFNLLQNFRRDPSASKVCYYVFDLLCWRNRDTTRLRFLERRALVNAIVGDIRDSRVRISDYLRVSAADMLAAIREQGLEGVVGKRIDSVYEPGQRTGAWTKHRLNLGQKFVIGGYTPGPYGLDSIIVGYYRGKELICVARTRNGFVPASRRRVFEKLQPLVTAKCPFVNLPEIGRSRWGEALDADKMKKCVWVRPELVAQIEFLERPEQRHLRHARFAGIRDDKDPRKVVQEHSCETD
jgi:bifunctional non-homologous end joining protein LigD